MPSEQPGEGRGVRAGPSRRDDRNRQTMAEGAVRLGADVSECPRQHVGFPLADLADLK